MLRECKHTGTVLAVDDEAAILRLVESILQPNGYLVHSAVHARAAMEIFTARDKAIDVLLTDVVMPDLSGPVLASKLCSMDPKLRVLFMSGHHDGALVQQFAGFKGYQLLPKPFTESGLLKAIREAMR
jgi:DNA-binding NtrC family response regulator